MKFSEDIVDIQLDKKLDNFSTALMFIKQKAFVDSSVTNWILADDLTKCFAEQFNAQITNYLDFANNYFCFAFQKHIKNETAKITVVVHLKQKYKTINYEIISNNGINAINQYIKLQEYREIAYKLKEQKNDCINKYFENNKENKAIEEFENIFLLCDLVKNCLNFMDRETITEKSLAQIDNILTQLNKIIPILYYEVGSNCYDKYWDKLNNLPETELKALKDCNKMVKIRIAQKTL